MTHIDPEHVARTARLDQYRAEASRTLDKFIELYRAQTNPRTGDDTGPFSMLVTAAYRYVDPDDDLPTPRSNGLIFIAEVLAVAVTRLTPKAEAR